MKTRFTAISFGLAMAAAVYLLFGPVYTGHNGERTTHATMLQVNGAWAIAPVIFPPLLAQAPLVVRKQWVRIGVTIVMAAFAFISGFSIGLFYWPAVILMLVAACAEDSGTGPEAGPTDH